MQNRLIIFSLCAHMAVQKRDPIVDSASPSATGDNLVDARLKEIIDDWLIPLVVEEYLCCTESPVKQIKQPNQNPQGPSES